LWAGLTEEDNDQRPPLWVSTAIDRLDLHRSALTESSVRVLAKLTTVDGEHRADLRVLADDGRLLGTVHGARFASLDVRDLEAPGARAPSVGKPVVDEGLLPRLMTADSASMRRALLADVVRAHVGAVAHVDPQAVDVDQPLRGLGIDSALAQELRARLERETGLRLSATLVWNHPTVAVLAEFLLELLLPDVAVPEPPAPAPVDASGLPAPRERPEQSARPPADPEPTSLTDIDRELDELARLSGTEQS
jgi:acyl carrier protein